MHMREKSHEFRRLCLKNAPIYPRVSAPCLNVHGNDGDCEYWARIGECEANRKWMSANCRRTCGRCAPTTFAPIGIIVTAARKGCLALHFLSCTTLKGALCEDNTISWMSIFVCFCKVVFH